MTAANFYEYITNVFYKWLLKNGIEFPIILYIDGHSSHHTKPLADFCKEKQIHVILLYPNATHILQPLDVSVFEVLKEVWKQLIIKWRIEHDGAKMKTQNFAPLFQKALQSLDSKKLLINGFRTIGLYPLSSAAINLEKIFAGAKLEKPKTQPTIRNQSELLKFTLKEYQSMEKSIQADIPSEMLNIFEVCEREGSWNGPENFEQLFHHWLNTRQSIRQCSNNDAEDMVIFHYIVIYFCNEYTGH